MSELQLMTTLIGQWDVSIVQFVDDARSLSAPAFGFIANSDPTSKCGRLRLVEWKHNVAETIKTKRGANAWNPSDHCAISIGFSFCLQAHRNQKLDVENFMKPTIDALAAGLFCPNDQVISAIERYDFDDSNFRYLFVYRLDDAITPSEEGVGINISVQR